MKYEEFQKRFIRNAEIKASEESMRAEIIEDDKRIEYERFTNSVLADPFTDKESLEDWAEGIYEAYEDNPPKMTTEPGRVAAGIIKESIIKIETIINSL